MGFLSAIVAVIASISSANAASAFPQEVDDALSSSQPVVMYSLEPWSDPESKVKRFHGYQVLGTLTLNADQRKRAVAAFRDAVSSYSDPGYAAACFDPRHALHIVNAGHTFDILLCYQCLSVQVFRDDESIAYLGAAGSPRVLNALLHSAKVRVSNSGGNPG